MRDHDRHHELRRWLAAEAEAAEEGGEAREAEAALSSLFEVLPRQAPPPGFARRVMARAAAVIPRAAEADTGSRSGWAERLAAALPTDALPAQALRAAVVFAVAVVGTISLLLAPAGWELVQGQARGLGWSLPFHLVADVFLALSEGLEGSFQVWEFVSRFAGPLGRLVTRPAVVAMLASSVAVAALAFRLLLDLTVRDRSWSHAETV